MTEGETLLRTVATACVHLSRLTAPGDQVYPASVQRAYNMVVLYCVRAGTEPPASVPHMAAWAAGTRLEQWPADFGDSDTDLSQVLVDPETRVPTQACMEWAVHASDVPAELFENAVIDEALLACTSAQSPASYTAFRRLLITRPVLTAADLALLSGDFDLRLVLDTIKRCYEPAPAAYLRNGVYRLCARCGCLLALLNGGRYRCELDRCRKDGDLSLGDGIPAETRPQQLARPLRVFITSPGIAETDLEDRLRGLRLEPEMWPRFDAYDLRVPLPDGRVWAVDVKDWANPSLLGRDIRGFRSDPPYDRAFIVVPEYRFRVRENYARVFTNNLAPELEGKVEICSDEEFVKLVKKELAHA